MKKARSALAVYACLSAVYLLYLPHALPKQVASLDAFGGPAGAPPGPVREGTLNSRHGLAVLGVLYCIGRPIPVSTGSRGAGRLAILEAVVAAGPIHSDETLIFAGSSHAMGTAPSFITGASWSLSSMLEHQTGAERVQGARDVLASERGELALYWPGSIGRFARDDLSRLHVFKCDPSGRFVPQSLVALSAPQGRFELVPLHPSVHTPVQVLTR